MKNKLTVYTLLLLLLGACKKETIAEQAPPAPIAAERVSLANFTDYTIYQGEHYCDKSTYVAVDYQQLSFRVIFDSSAIYTSVIPENQYDINKLYGFADNQAHHQEYSARFGWRWSDNALYLFAYVYNAGVRVSEKLGAVPLLTPVQCSISALGNQYVFAVNGKKTILPRLATTTRALGYKLYPYFGGDEIAPHTIRIRIEEQN